MLVSVIIPSYNHSQYVAQAVESVLDQNWPHIDLIVIDDGSTDGSPEIIRGLHQKRGGFRFVARENKGLIKTLNEGLKAANGEFFCELASDDYFPVDSIEQRVKYLQQHPDCVAVFGDGHLVRGESDVTDSMLDERRRQVFFTADPIPDMLQGALPVFSTGLIRRQALVEMGGFDENIYRYYEDLEAPLRLSLAGRLGFIDSQLICRRDHDANVSKTTPHIRVEKVLCYRKLYEDPAFARYRALIGKLLTREYLKLGRYLSKNGGGKAYQQEVFRGGWSFAGRDPRLLWYLLKSRTVHDTPQ